MKVVCEEDLRQIAAAGRDGFDLVGGGGCGCGSLMIFFGPGESGETPIIAPSKSTDRDTTLDALGFAVNTHRMRIAVPTQTDLNI